MTLPPLLAITPPDVGPWVQELDQLWQLGVGGIIVRLLDCPSALASVCDVCPKGMTVLVRPVHHADAHWATAAGRGLHLPSHMPPQHWRNQTDAIISVACHSRQQLHRAAASGADMALLSPVFSPTSKPNDTRPTLGVEQFAHLTEDLPIPVYALGGITPARVPQLSKAHGLAAIGAFFRGGHVDTRSTQAMVSAWHARQNTSQNSR